MKELTNERKGQIEMLIRFYNYQANARYKFSESNMISVDEALTRANGDVGKLKTYIREKARKSESIGVGLTGFFNSYYEAPEVSPKPEATSETSAATALGTIEKVLVELLAKTKLDDIKENITEKIHEDARKFIQDEYGIIERKVIIDTGDARKELTGVVHEKFDTVLKFVKNDEPVFLTGAAGTGKNFLCKQIAETLDLDFYFSNAVTQEYKLTGFTDANGTYHETQFYKAFKNGGLFLLDEMDASIPEVLIILNAAIANRYFDFPAPIGYVEAHPDFRVIAAGNTFGNGADYDYVGRNQLDAASLDRFALVRIDYDERIERNCANGDEDLLRFCHAFRKATAEAGIRTVVSYRAISRMAKLTDIMSKDELIRTCLTKSLGKDDLNIIKSELGGCGAYTDGFNKLVAEVQ